MSSLELQEKQVILNSQFQENQTLIEKLQLELLNECHLTETETLLTQQFLNDKVSLFRSLKENGFDYNKAKTQLSSTIRWRLDNHVDQLTFHDCMEFCENGFAFFHGTDNTGDHPLIFVRLRFFPKRRTHTSLSDQIRPYAAFIMEMARKLTWDMTCDRIKQGHPYPLVSRMTVLVNVTKSPILPVDVELVKTMSTILNDVFPGLVQSINVLNFGWMYQGVWSVLKYLLSEEAKSFIRFTTVQELSATISKDRILQELGGYDDYQWSIENDEVLQKYGVHQIELPHTPPLSTKEDSSPLIERHPSDVISRSNSSSNSSSSSSDSSDEFFDALIEQPQVQPQVPLIEQPQVPLIEQPQVPLIEQPQMPLIEQPVSPQAHRTSVVLSPQLLRGNSTSFTGLRTNNDFLTSFMHTSRPSEKTIVHAEPQTIPTHLLDDIKAAFQVSFGPHHAYLILFYLFLRGPVESVVQKSLTHTSLVENKRIAGTSIGITAVIAAVLGTKLTKYMT